MMESHKSSMDPYYRSKAFGKVVDGGLAPNGFCYACGGTENLLVLERLDIIAAGTPTVSPLCSTCKDRGIEFRCRKSSQTNLGRGDSSKLHPPIEWVSGMLTMARYKTKSSKTLLYPGLVTSCGPSNNGPYGVLFFDGDVLENVPLSALEPFVSVNTMVYAKFNKNTEGFYPARVTAVHTTSASGATSVKELPDVTVDLLFTDDNETRKKCPLSQLYRPLRENSFSMPAGKSARDVASATGTTSATKRGKRKRS
jgi:hypothetical protein